MTAKTEKDPRVIAIIPAYNEQTTIPKVIKEVKNYVDEIIVIDDGSTDKTIKVSKDSGAHVLPNIINRGLGTTIRRGYREALRRGADIVVQIDADGQYTTEDIPKLIEPIVANKADMVIGSRVKGGIEKMPFGNKIGNRIGTIVTKIVSGFPVSDAQSGFRAMRKELLEEIQPMNTYTYTQEMIIRASKEGWRIFEVPSFFKKRSAGPSRLISNLFNYAKKAILIITRTVMEYHPLLFFGIPGVLLTLIGVGFGISLLHSYSLYLHGGPIQYRTGTMVFTSLLIMSGIIIFCIGLIADFIQHKFKQMNETIIYKDMMRQKSKEQ